MSRSDAVVDAARYRSLIADLNALDLNPNVFNYDQSFNVNCKYYDCQELNAITVVSKFNFSAFHLNISSLSRHFDELNALLSILNLKFSVIGISESRFLKHSPPIFDFNIEGYSVEHTPTESSAGGALLYISNRFSYTVRSDLSQLLYSPRDLESVFVEISFSRKSNIIVGCIYRHPGMSIATFNSDFFSPFLQLVSRENKSILLLGDFNINLLKYNSSQEVSNFLDLLGSHLILPQVILPTRITETSRTLIDNIFSTITESSISGNILHNISDHLSQFLCFSFPGNNSNGKSHCQTFRNWSKFNQGHFVRDFRALNWNEVLGLEHQNIDISLGSFFAKTNALVDQHLPTANLTKKQSQQKPWITSGIVKSMSKRDFFYRKFLQSKTEDTRNFYHNLFKRHRNLIVCLCKRSKANYFANYFHKNSRDIRKIWQGVKDIISLKASSSAKPISLKINGTVTSDPLLVANSFNSYFSSVAGKIRSEIPESDRHFSSFLKRPNLNSVFLSPVTSDEVCKLIQSMSCSKSWLN